jgi:hypothetical protein
MLLLGTDGSRTYIENKNETPFRYEKLQELCGSKKTRKLHKDLTIKTYGDMGLVLVENEFSLALMHDNFNALATEFAKEAASENDKRSMMYFGDVVFMNLWELDEKSIEFLKEKIDQDKCDGDFDLNSIDRSNTQNFWKNMVNNQT